MRRRHGARRSSRRLALCLFAVTTVVFGGACQAPTGPFDLLISGGTVIDGLADRVGDVADFAPGAGVQTDHTPRQPLRNVIAVSAEAHVEAATTRIDSVIHSNVTGSRLALAQEPVVSLV